MVQFDNQSRQIKIKIVYYGPALGGKTTCLQHIHRVTDPERRTKLYSLNTASDRTLFFDLLALDLGQVRGYRLTLQLYTVPGQVQYNATRRAVLSGADGVVFVADSQRSQRQANRDSLANLRENLAANGIDRDAVPVVFQLNKRDLDDLLPVQDLDGDLNPRRDPSFPSVALRGDGVMEAFAAVSERTLVAVADRLGLGGGPKVAERLVEHVRGALAPFVGSSAPLTVSTDAGDVEVTRPVVEDPPDGVLSEDDLVGEAVRANVAMTGLNVRLDAAGRRLERKAGALAGVAEYGRSLAAVETPDEVLEALVATAARLLGVRRVALLRPVAPGEVVRGPSTGGELDDPLVSSPGDGAATAAEDLLAAARPRLLAADLEDDDTAADRAVRRSGAAPAVVAPLDGDGGPLALLVAYADPRGRPLDDDDLQVAAVLAATAAVGHRSAGARQRLAALNRDLEREVTRRTRQLEDAYRELGQLDRIKDELLQRLAGRLRGPVDSLRSASRALQQQGADEPGTTRQLSDLIRARADALAGLVDSVEQAAGLAGPGATAELRPAPVRELLRRALSPLRDLGRQRQVRLQLLVSGDLDTVHCVPDLLQLAVRAVVKNALQHSRPGGEVKVEVRGAGPDGVNHVVVRVVDAGVGMERDEQERVFDAFHRGETAGGDASDGVGLGLTIARRVALAHGGAIDLKSAPGRGTEVALSIPQPSSSGEPRGGPPGSAASEGA